MRHDSLALWAALIAATAAAASGGCGGGSATSAEDGGADTSSGSSASSSGSGSGSGAGSSSGSSSGGGSRTEAGGPDAGLLSGEVQVAQCEGPDAICPAPALFYASADFNLHYPCTNEVFGACRFYTCTSTNLGDGDGAGTIAISGGSIPAGTALVPTTGNGYYTSTMGTFLASGDAVTIAASGGTVPAFGPTTLTVPPLLALTAPQLSASGNSVIPASTDLAVAWTGGQSGATTLLEFFPTSTNPQYVVCDWDAALGQGTVNAAVLGKLAPLGQSSVLYGQEATNRLTAGPYSILEIVWPYSGQLATVQ
jgi:hypothetical protein